MDEQMKILLALKKIKDGPEYPSLRLFIEAQSASALAGMDGASSERTQQLSGKVLAFEWLLQYLDHQLEAVIEHIKTQKE